MSTIKKHWGLGFWSTALIFVVAAIWASQSGYFPISPALASQEVNSIAPAKSEAPQANPARHEVVEKRTETSRTFDNGDGTLTAEIHTGPIHYKDSSGLFKPINTKVTKSPTIPQNVKAALAGKPADEPTETYAYAAEENSIRAYFKEKANEGDMFRAEVGDYYLTWQPISINWVHQDGSQETIATVHGVDSFNQNNEVFYYDLFPEIDEQFSISRGQIKDTFIIYSPPPFPIINAEKLSINGIMRATKGLSFLSNGNKVNNKLTTSLPINILTANNSSLLTIESAIYWDSTNDKIPNIATYDLINYSDYIAFTISIPAEWVLSSDRTYPIIIDPQYTLTQYSSKDTYVSSACPTSSFGGESYFYVGYNDNLVPVCNSMYRGEMQSFIGFPNFAFDTCTTINSAILKLYVSEDSNAGTPVCSLFDNFRLMIGQFSGAWSEGINWNSTPASYWLPETKNCYTGAYDVLCFTVNNSGNAYQSLDITGYKNALRDWTSAKFIQLYSCSTSGDNWVRIQSRENSNDPYLTINFSVACTPSTTCCSSGGCWNSAGTWCLGTDTCSGNNLCLDLSCNSSGSCNVPINCSSCGTQSCPSDSCYDNGLDSPTGTNYCVQRDYPPSCNKTCSSGSCQSCTCSPAESTVATCGLCKYCNGCSCANYSSGTSCGGSNICDGNGNCIAPGCSSTPSAPSQPSAPTVTCNSVTIQWSAVSPPANCTILGYNVYRGATKLNSTPVSGTSYTDNTVSANTTYTYTVKAVDEAGEGSPSPGRSVTTPACSCTTTPSAPSQPSAPTVTCNSVTLQWSAVSPPAGCTITGYNIYRGSTKLNSTPVSGTTYTDNTVSASSTYTYTVKAVDEVGEGSPSPGRSVTTPACSCPTLPPAPGQPSASTISCNSVTIQWSAVSPPANCTITSYKVYRNSTYLAPVTSGTSYTDNSVSASTTYNYTVSAVDQAGEGNQSTARSVTTPPCSCTPNCSGQVCGGDDGCGGTCQTGTCPTGETCNNGVCEPTGCVKNCSGRECGADPVCGQSCGSCGSGKTCSSGKCVASSSSSSSSDDGGGCGSCAIVPQDLSPQASAFYDMIYMLPYLSLLAYRVLRPNRRKK